MLSIVKARHEQRRRELIPIAVLAFFANLLGLAAAMTEVPSGPSSLAIFTHLGTQAPPKIGAPVCLAGTLGSIGTVKSVRLQPGHESAHDLWMVGMELHGHDVSRLPMDSVVYALTRLNFPVAALRTFFSKYARESLALD